MDYILSSLFALPPAYLSNARVVRVYPFSRRLDSGYSSARFALQANLRTSSSGVFVLIEGLRKKHRFITVLLACPGWTADIHLPQLRTNVRGNNTVLARYFALNSSQDCFLFAVTPAYLSDARVVRVQRPRLDSGFHPPGLPYRQTCELPLREFSSL